MSLRLPVCINSYKTMTDLVAKEERCERCQ